MSTNVAKLVGMSEAKYGIVTSTSQRLSDYTGELSMFSVRLLILKPLGEDFFVDDASLVTDGEVCKRLLSFSSYIYIID